MSEISSEELKNAENRVLALLEDVHVPPEEMNWPEAGEKFLRVYEDFADLQGRGSEEVQQDVSRARMMLYEASEACGGKYYEAMKQAGAEAAHCLNRAWYASRRGV